ncbi:MAG: hypothetical protein RBS73_04235 [Prolixibacteraceae bacterium]|jgi:hypothetical protein|nr:hypothetical protein [Prolixibacteraceae bacterium]
MKTTATKPFRSAGRILLLAALFLVLPHCYQDEDLNYRILIDNHCDFALKVYYDNQEIEYYDDYVDDITVTGSVSLIEPYGSKLIHSKYSSVWIEPDVNHLRSGKFRSYNDGSWRKRIDVYEEDFRGDY